MDTTNPENYAPICDLPQLCKLLSKTLHIRLYAELDRYQCIDISVPTMQGSENIPNNGPLFDVQTHLPEKQRVGDGHVGGSDRLPEGIRFL